jgi:hypothetical protein
MNPKLQALWEDAMKRLQAVADDLEARGAIPMSDNFPMLGSFAEDEPEAHAAARGYILEHAQWVGHGTGDYSLPKGRLPVQHTEMVSRDSKNRARLDLTASSDWIYPPVAAPLRAVSFCAA